MKKKFLKKMITLMVALVIPLGLATTAFADDAVTSPITPGVTPNTDVKAIAGNSYSINIPSQYDFATITKTIDDSFVYQKGTVSVGLNMIDATSHITVGVTTTNLSMVKTGDTDSTIAFQLYPSDPGTAAASTPFENDSAAALTINSGDTTASKDYVVGFNRKNIPATGEYHGPITFTVSVD